MDLSTVEARRAVGADGRRVRALIVVEGIHDVHFLRRLGSLLHVADPALPDLRSREERGQLIFVPFGGGDVLEWTSRFTALRLPEFHLYDRELPPETASRARAVELVNRRPGCRACLTGKRSLENYLHPAAIYEAHGIAIDFGDEDEVPLLAARACYQERPVAGPWTGLTPGARKRLKGRAKHWLNTYAADRMTLDRLFARDPDGEITSWLATIGHLMA